MNLQHALNWARRAVSLIFLIVASAAPQATVIAHRQETQTVSAIVIYQNSCGAPCAPVWEILEQLQSKFGGQLEIATIDADLPANQPVVQRLLRNYGVPEESRSFPLLLVGQTALVGVSEISRNADTAVETTIQQGDGASPLVRGSQSTSQDLAVSPAIWQILTLVFGCLSTLLAIALIFALLSGQRARKSARAATVQVTRADEAGFIRTLIGQGHYSTDFLAVMLAVAEKYRSDGTVPTSAGRLARDFMVMVGEYLSLSPVEQLNTKVIYSPDRHVAYGPLRAGDSAWVVEPGWQRNSKILKKAGVQARRAT